MKSENTLYFRNLEMYLKCPTLRLRSKALQSRLRRKHLKSVVCGEVALHGRGAEAERRRRGGGAEAGQQQSKTEWFKYNADLRAC
jgi:hypothetical protein